MGEHAMSLEIMKMQILEVGLLILAAYVGGKIARKLKIGEVIGQILGGILVGPHFLELIHRFLQHHEELRSIIFFQPIYHFYTKGGFDQYYDILEGYHFFVFLFLGIIAFSIGEELHRDRLKQVGIKATLICIIQGLLTFVLLTLGFRFLFPSYFNWVHACIIGSIGIATAPALTFVLMNKLRIEGSLRNILANIVVLDDILEVIFFSIFLGIAMKHGKELSVLKLTWHVVSELVLAALIGVAIFFVLNLTIRQKKTDSDSHHHHHDKDRTFLSTVLSEHPTPSVEILLIMIGIISVGIAVAIHFDLPFLITAVVAGFLISNFHSHAIFDSLKIENVMPIFNLLFFAIIGASVRLESFSSKTILLVLTYLVLRTTGKLFGNWFGAKITKQDPKITASLPKLMLPQAGMAAVETILVATVLGQKGGGTLIFDVIIPALVVFELGGAWLSERTLLRWKHWTVGEREALMAKKREAGDFNLHDLLHDRVFEMMATTREEAIFELAQTMVRSGIISETAIITNSLLEREKLASTAIGNGVAFPHCRIASIDRTVATCGIIGHPVEWNAPDGKPVDLLFLILTPEEHPEQHLKAIKTIATALRQDHFRENIDNALRQQNVEQWLHKLDTANV